MKIHKVLALTLAMVLTACTVPTTVTQAAEITWRAPGDSCYYLDGTDIVVKLDGAVLRVTGTGDIPDFDYWTKDTQRPWKGAAVEAIIIDNTITSIGSYAFADLGNVKYITMGTNTFIKDVTCFSGLPYKPIFRISEAGVTTKYYGTIPYTSLDSIAAYAQSNTNGAAYVFDTNKEAVAFQNMTNPTIQLVYAATDTTAPWNNVEVNGNGNVVTRLAYMAPENVDPSYVVTAQMRYPGEACYQVYAAFIGDYKYACSIRVNVTKNQEEVKTTDTAYKYVIDIPQQYRNLGTSYRLIGIGSGQVYFFDDLDSVPSTLTYQTTMPTMTFALVYK